MTGTTPNPAAYTGPKTRDHVLFFKKIFADPTAVPPIAASPSRIRFAGYDSAPWFDYVYTEQLDIQNIEFDIKPNVWDFHTFHRMGFFFMCQRSPTPILPIDNGDGTYTYDSSNGTISGYVMSIGDINHNSLTANAVVNFELYYVTNMDIDAYNGYITSTLPGAATTGQTNFTTPLNNTVYFVTPNSYTAVSSTLLNTYCGYAAPTSWGTASRAMLALMPANPVSGTENVTRMGRI